MLFISNCLFVCLFSQRSRIPLLDDDVEFFDEGVIVRPVSTVPGGGGLGGPDDHEAAALRPMTSVVGRRRR